MGARSGGGGGARGGGGYASQSRTSIANTLTTASGMDRWNNNSRWDHYYNESFKILNAASKTNTFGGQIAKDIIAKTEAAERKYKKQLTPRVSPKQAWAIANALSKK